MIFGIGLDIIEIARIQKMLEKHAERFTHKIFTKNEVKYCQSRPNPGNHFAARFAAKEAVLKSLGTGMAQGINWKDIEIVNESSGRPILYLTGKGKEIFDTLNLKNIHISISHDKVYAIAQAIAESN